MIKKTNNSNNNKPSLTEFKNEPDILEDCIYEDLLLALDGVRQELRDNGGQLSVHRTNQLLALTKAVREMSERYKKDKRYKTTMNTLIDDIPFVKSSLL